MTHSHHLGFQRAAFNKEHGTLPSGWTQNSTCLSIFICLSSCMKQRPGCLPRTWRWRSIPSSNGISKFTAYSLCIQNMSSMRKSTVARYTSQCQRWFSQSWYRLFGHIMRCKCDQDYAKALRAMISNPLGETCQIPSPHIDHTRLKLTYTQLTLGCTPPEDEPRIEMTGWVSGNGNAPGWSTPQMKIIMNYYKSPRYSTCKLQFNLITSQQNLSKI